MRNSSSLLIKMIECGCTVAVVGDSMVGKSSLVAALCDARVAVSHPFPYCPTYFPECSVVTAEGDDVSSAVGIGGTPRLFSQRTRKRARVTFVDTPGDRDMESFAVSAALSASVIVVVVDRSRSETLEYAERMLSGIPHKDVVVVACKEDEDGERTGGAFTRRQGAVVLSTESEAADFLRRHGAQYVQVSLVTGAGVRQAAQTIGKMAIRCVPPEERRRC